MFTWAGIWTMGGISRRGERISVIRSRPKAAPTLTRSPQNLSRKDLTSVRYS